MNITKVRSPIISIYHNVVITIDAIITIIAQFLVFFRTIGYRSQFGGGGPKDNSSAVT